MKHRPFLLLTLLLLPLSLSAQEKDTLVVSGIQEVPVVIHRADLVGDGYCDLVAQTDESYLSSQGCSSTNTFSIARLHGGAFNTATVALDNRSDWSDTLIVVTSLDYI